MKGAALQSAIYSVLSNDAALMALITGVYADIEQPNDSGSSSNFPYVTIGSDNLASWDSKTFFGTEAVCQIDAWSRSNNLLEAKNVGEAIVDALHCQPMTISGASHVLTRQENSVYTKDPDGHTKRGLLTFRVIYTRD